MSNKFEKLIEYVINDEADKARELFHDIVVEKSREIYENLMDEDDCMGGDASDDLIDDIETEEEGISMEDEDFDDEEVDIVDGDDEEEFDFDSEEYDDEDEDLEDRVVDLEDKLDELMAEFEAMIGDDGDEFGDDEDFEMDDEEDFDIEGGDELEVDDTEEFMNENIKLSAAPKPVTSEPSGTNTRSINASNSGAVGAVAKPVKMVGDTAHGRSAPKAGNLPDAGQFKNVPAKDNSKLSSAPKPVTSQASGVNTRTPFPKS